MSAVTRPTGVTIAAPDTYRVSADAPPEGLRGTSVLDSLRARAVAAEFPNPEPHVARAALLLPVYRVKWCCILLNEFLPVGGRRRQFSTAADQEARKVAQLTKARAALAAVVDRDASQRMVA